tara:strand:- start:3036 stop:3275 length:240 start_codon:yes stop_codon:yes gene_type:complete
MQPKVGDLVKWVVDWHSFAASEDGTVEGYEPIYAYGIVTHASPVGPVAVYFYDWHTSQWTSLYMIHDKFEIVSRRNEAS